MCMICLHKNFHMPSFNGSLGITITLKVKYSLHTAVILLLYILQKNTLKRPYIKWC